jgi:transposase-like protein
MQRKKFDATTKAKVALEAAKGARTANEIAGQYDCHPAQVSQWKKERKDVTADADHDEALRQIGQLQMELAWLKKKSAQLRS